MAREPIDPHENRGKRRAKRPPGQGTAELARAPGLPHPGVEQKILVPALKDTVKTGDESCPERLADIRPRT
jgi:hypothetical protein